MVAGWGRASRHLPLLAAFVVFSPSPAEEAAATAVSTSSAALPSLSAPSVRFLWTAASTWQTPASAPLAFSSLPSASIWSAASGSPYSFAASRAASLGVLILPPFHFPGTFGKVRCTSSWFPGLICRTPSFPPSAGPKALRTSFSGLLCFFAALPVRAAPSAYWILQSGSRCLPLKAGWNFGRLASTREAARHPWLSWKGTVSTWKHSDISLCLGLYSPGCWTVCAWRAGISLFAR